MTLQLIIASCLLTGLLLSFVLVQHYINEAGGFAEKWCSKTGGSKDKNDNCTSILDSRFAKTFGISHADFGVIYFGGTLLLVITSTSIPWLVSLLGLSAVCYSFFSIIIQKYVLRQWCTLCLLVQASVIIQAAIIFSNAKLLTLTPNSFKEAITSIVIFLIPTLLWWLIRKLLIERNHKKSGLHPLLSAKSLTNFRKQKGKQEIEALEGDLIYETPNLPESRNKKGTPWRVVIAIAPSCTHCGEFLESIISLIEVEQLPIHLRIRFAVIGLDDNQEGINDQTVTETVMALANSDGHNAAIKSLRSWYQDFQGKDLIGWIKSIRTIEDHERNMAGVFMADNSFWLQEKDVEETPSVFIEEQAIAAQDSTYTAEVLRKLCSN